MEYLSSLLSLLPLVIVVVCVLLRVRPVAACSGGIAAVLLIIFFSGGDFARLPPSPWQSAAAVLILSLSVALVVVPGLWLNALLRESGIIKNLADNIAALPRAREDKALIILLGAAPAVESLTGFGVSLFVTVPIFLRLFARPLAARLSLLGMNIMPWGTLALATAVGAALAGEDFSALGFATAKSSIAVFPTLGAIAAALLGGGMRRVIFGAFVGGVLSAGLLFFNRYFFAETAGIFAGLTAALIGFALAARRDSGDEKKEGKQTGDASWAAALWPYALLLALVCAARGIAPLREWLEAPVLRTGELAYSPLASPGLPLALTALAVYYFRRRAVAADTKTALRGALSGALRKAVAPLSAIFFFMAFAQIFRDGGFLTTIATALAPAAASGGGFFSPLLGMLSGYVTGSNVGGNALLIPMQAELGAAASGALEWAALQNSGAGHAIFASLPIIVLAQAVAGGDDKKTGDGGESAKTAGSDTAALARFGLLILPLIWLALCAPAIVRFVFL